MPMGWKAENRGKLTRIAGHNANLDHSIFSPAPMINILVFLSLCISGVLLGLGYFLSLNEIGPRSISGLFLTIGVILGWFSAIAGCVSFLVGAVLFVSGKLTDYWGRLYPVNGGLVLLGLVFIQFAPGLLVLSGVAALCGIALAVVLHRLKAEQWRVLPLILIPIPFIVASFGFMPSIMGVVVALMGVVVALLMITLALMRRWN